MDSEGAAAAVTLSMGVGGGLETCEDGCISAYSFTKLLNEEAIL